MAEFIHITKISDQPYSFDKAGDYVVFFHNISGKLDFEIKSQGINLEIYGLFTGKNSDEFNIGTIQHHMAPNSTSNLLIKGIFDDKSKLIYEGLIRIEEHCNGSHAYQKNQNLIQSKEAFVDSRPFLEILSNDVFCTHGSTTGAMNKEEIEYIKSRGIKKSDAIQLIGQGFIEDLYLKVKARVPEFEYSL